MTDRVRQPGPHRHRIPSSNRPHDKHHRGHKTGKHHGQTAASNSTKQPWVSSTLASTPVIPLTADMVIKIAPKVMSSVKTAASLNKMIELSKVQTALGEAMLIAQVAVESGGFTKPPHEEDYVDGLVVYNASLNVPDNLKQKFLGRKHSNRYLRHSQLPAWKKSQALFFIEKAKYEKDHLEEKFENSQEWKNRISKLSLTDYYPGDQELPYYKLLYSPNSPDAVRAKESKKNGNDSDADARNYVGHGYIQLTWKNNYKAAGEFLKIDLIGQPEKAMEEETAIQIAAWFWNSKGCNTASSVDTETAFKNVSYKVNGGEVGLSERIRYFAVVKNVFAAAK